MKRILIFLAIIAIYALFAYAAINKITYVLYGYFGIIAIVILYVFWLIAGFIKDKLWVLIPLLLLLFPLCGWGQSLPDSIYGGGGTVTDSSGHSIYSSPERYLLRAIKLCEVIVNGKCYSKTDTIPGVTIDVQYTRRSVPFTTDVYLINGEPWYRSTAPLTRGKWCKISCYRWRISEGWNTQNNK